MSKRTFEQAFNAVFHTEESFADFCSFEVKAEVETFKISNKTVYKTSDKYKKYLRFIDAVVLRFLAKKKSVVHSFTKGKSTLTAVQGHSDSRYFFLTDIESFYPNIKSVDVTRLLERDKDLIPISDIGNYTTRLVELMTLDNSIPVGFSTSPQLSNAFLFEFDCALKSYCDENKLVYTRYADDIVISGTSFDELSELKNITQKLLNDYASTDLLLKTQKTHITHLGNKVKILGLCMLPNGKITIDAKYKKKLELLLHFHGTDKIKYQSYLDAEFKGSEQSLFGMLHYAKSIDSAYLIKLQRKYGVHAVRKLMEKTA